MPHGYHKGFSRIRVRARFVWHVSLFIYRRRTSVHRDGMEVGLIAGFFADFA